jgi:integrase
MANGSVTKRGESWRARFRHPETGRQHQATFRRQADAQRWLRKQLEAIDAGRWADPRSGRVTLSRFFEAWAARQVWEDGTHKAMSLAVRSATFCDMELRRIRPTHVEAWVKSMTVPHGGRKQPLAPGTIKTRFANVRSVFRAAVRDHLIASPTQDVRLPRQRKRAASMAIPSPEDVRALLDAAEAPFRAFVAVCAFAGLRLGEAAALQVEDVDFLRRELRVRRQVQRIGQGAIELRLPKYGSERTVPIPDELVQILAAHVDRTRCNTWLFTGTADNPPHQNTLGHRWRTTLRAAHRSGIRLHDLRHFTRPG